jgi:hypothetical protein
MLRKTGARAVEAEGLTTQQWTVPGALSRTQAQPGMRVGDLARDRRSRLVCMTEPGRKLWIEQVAPKIQAYYENVLANFSSDDMTHALHYLLKLLDNMKRVDEREHVMDDAA